ncbi:hypothetical protein [Chryseobacterium pennae]|nr:hypothetical protein [Chryseobacterium pennae]
MILSINVSDEFEMSGRVLGRESFRVLEYESGGRKIVIIRMTDFKP